MHLIKSLKTITTRLKVQVLATTTSRCFTKVTELKTRKIRNKIIARTVKRVPMSNRLRLIQSRISKAVIISQAINFCSGLHLVSVSHQWKVITAITVEVIYCLIKIMGEVTFSACLVMDRKVWPQNKDIRSLKHLRMTRSFLEKIALKKIKEVWLVLQEGLPY